MKWQLNMQLSELLQGYTQLTPAQDVRVTELCMLCQDCKPGSVFFQQKNSAEDNRDFITVAVKQGARVVIQNGYKISVVEKKISTPRLGYLLITLPNLRSLLSVFAQRFYKPKFELVKCIGVTGTNGKTSTVRLLTQALGVLGYSAAMIGTLGVGFLDKLQETGYTTPDVFTLYRHIASLIKNKAEYIVMEVSSHALEQSRTAGIPFHTVAFTNLTRDHLDYHKTMESYLTAKKLLFKNPSIRHAVVNLDDQYASEFLDCCHKRVIKTGFGFADISNKPKDNNASEHQLFNSVYLKHKKNLDIGYELTIKLNLYDEIKFTTQLMGEFNIANLLAVVAILSILDVRQDNIAKAMSALSPVKGRLQAVSCSHKALCIIDYAHTPDALEKALLACREFTKDKLVCVFGCGGDRDKGKRPLMAKVAQAYADKIIVTSDNPRTESMQQIADDISTGFTNLSNVEIVLDRKQAIYKSIKQASSNDVILIAGKGHENYQIIGLEKTDFCDATIAKDILY